MSRPLRHIDGPFRVFVGLVPTGYLNSEAIDRVVRDGIAFCGLSSLLGRLGNQSRILVQPDVLMAENRLARHSYTHPDVVRATLASLLSASPSAQATVLGRALPGFSAARIFRRAHAGADAFRQSGYYELEDLFPGRVELLGGDESTEYRYQLSKGPVLSEQERRLYLSAPDACGAEILRGRVSNEIIAPRLYHDSQLIVYCPKLKSSVLSQGLSGAIRLGDPGYRGIFSDHHACDMLEVSNPQLIVTDGIVAAVGGNELTQRGHELGVVLVANNALAHDWVAAQILNLEPEKIGHLRMALERGWGPPTPNLIELGGDGADAVKQLGQKTKFWDLGYLPLPEFGPKFERENPGLPFPLEILSGEPYETSGAHGVVLDWLYLSYDNPKSRPRMARWPKATICVGAGFPYPAHFFVYAIGDRACGSLGRMKSSSRRLLRLGPLTVEKTQLKNGKRHLVFEIKGQPPAVRDLVLGFSVGSLGKLAGRLWSAALLLDRASFVLKRWLQPAEPRHQKRLVMTSRLSRNSWWALQPGAPELTGAAALPSARAPGPTSGR